MSVAKTVLAIIIAFFVIAVIIGLIVAEAQSKLSLYLDPKDPYNLTKACGNYVNLQVVDADTIMVDADTIMACVPYLNQTMLERFGLEEFGVSEGSGDLPLPHTGGSGGSEGGSESEEYTEDDN